MGKGERPGLHSLHDPMLVLPMVGLALLSLAPMVISRLRAKARSGAPVRLGAEAGPVTLKDYD
jgi:hypothetical protein